MAKRDVLSATGAVAIDYGLSQAIIALTKVHATVADHKHLLKDRQYARLDAVEKSLLAALGRARIATDLFKTARPHLRPMDHDQISLEEYSLDGNVTHSD